MCITSLDTMFFLSSSLLKRTTHSPSSIYPHSCLWGPVDWQLTLPFLVEMKYLLYLRCLIYVLKIGCGNLGIYTLMNQNLGMYVENWQWKHESDIKNKVRTKYYFEDLLLKHGRTNMNEQLPQIFWIFLPKLVCGNMKMTCNRRQRAIL